MPPDLQEEVKVELKLEVKDPLKVSLVFIFIFFMFWGYSNFDFGRIMILSSLSVRGDGLVWMLKVCAFFGGCGKRRKKKKCVNFPLVVFYRKLLVMVEWVNAMLFSIESLTWLCCYSLSFFIFYFYKEFDIFIIIIISKRQQNIIR